jgi:hypothetical protein
LTPNHSTAIDIDTPTTLKMATVYDDINVETAYSALSWHPTLPLLAAVGDSGIDILSAADGHKLAVVAAQDHRAGGNLRPVHEWHPSRPILAFTWSAGISVTGMLD